MIFFRERDFPESQEDLCYVHRSTPGVPLHSRNAVPTPYDGLKAYSAPKVFLRLILNSGLLLVFDRPHLSILLSSTVPYL